MGRIVFENRSLADRYYQIGTAAVRMILITCMLFFCLAYDSTSADNRYLMTGTVRARALAMGGAYHSVEDDFSAGFYNPGAFKINATQSERRFRLFFNPAASAGAFYDFSKYDYDFDRDDELTLGEALLSASLFLKGIAVTTPNLDFGLGLGEEVIDYRSTAVRSGRAVTVEGLANRSFHSAFVNVKIASPVSIGVAGTLYSSRQDGKTILKSGYTFGVILTPNPKLNVGIVYNQMPENFTDARMELESIENGSVTSGISYHFDDKTIVAIDLRTVNKEDQPTSREIHTGFERRFGERVALRAGYYRKKETNDDVLSFGIGILPAWEKISRYSKSTRIDVLSYSLVLDKSSFERRWHVLSLLLRL